MGMGKLEQAQAKDAFVSQPLCVFRKGVTFVSLSFFAAAAVSSMATLHPEKHVPIFPQLKVSCESTQTPIEIAPNSRKAVEFETALFKVRVASYLLNGLE